MGTLQKAAQAAWAAERSCCISPSRSAYLSVTSTAPRLLSSVISGQFPRQHATTNNRAFRSGSLSFLRKKSSIGVGSVDASQVTSSIGLLHVEQEVTTLEVGARNPQAARDRQDACQVL